MDPLLLARLLFAVTAGVHFLFVVTTLGLAPILTWKSWRNVVRPTAAGDGELRILGRMYLVNYAVGIVTGLVMELQMAMVWTGPGAAGPWNPVATLLGLETIVAFFLESTFLGLWLVGSGVLSRRVRAVLFTLVTVTAYVSATYVTAANSYLHFPIGDAAPTLGWGFVGRLVWRPATLTVLAHIAGAALVVGGMWAAAAGARVMQRGGTPAVANRLMRGGVITVAWSSVVTLLAGGLQFPFVRPTLPSQQTTPVFGALSMALMMLAGLAIAGVALMALLPLALRNRLVTQKTGRVWWPFLTNSVGLALLATFLGWLYREQMRSPWFIYQRVPLDEALAPISAAQLKAMLVVFGALTIGAAVLAWWLMRTLMHTDPPEEFAPDEALSDPIRFDHALVETTSGAVR
ncbi:cytochrome ubiquinol oxidase subunit I [Aestuariimicrobium soli]|uniref:cytochrome ubiquinol oxidase subunit I n=1 Tax=Aestuariimicrobium soli TaxID=2035834 RepID=UPI003EBC792F